MHKTTLIGLVGALGVIIGAFGAHGIKPYISENAYQNYQTGVLYHFIHTLAMLGIFLLAQTQQAPRYWKMAFYSFFSGIILFSGSLYLLSTREISGITGISWLGPITPLGGMCFVVGWLLTIPSKKIS